MQVSQTWSLVLKEECLLSVFDNREFRNLFGPKTEDVKGTEEDTQPNIFIIRGIKYRMKRTEYVYVAHLVQMRAANRVLVGKHGGKRRLGRTSVDGEIILKVDIKET